MNRYVIAIIGLLLPALPALSQTDDVDSIFASAYTLYQRNKPVEAVKLARRALDLAAQRDGTGTAAYAACLNLLGTILHVDNWDEAEALFKRALEILENAQGLDDPRIASTMNNLANIYHFQGRYDEAEALFKRSLATELKLFGPNYNGLAYPYNNLGHLYVELGRYAEAEPLLKRAIALDPSDSNAFNHLADTYREEGKYRDAERLYRRAIQTGNDHGRALTGLAVLHHRQRRFAESEAYFQKSLDLVRHWGHDVSYQAEVLNLRGGMYLDAQQWDRAFASYEAATKVYSDVRDFKLDKQIKFTQSKQTPLPYLNLATAGWALARQRSDLSTRIIGQTFEAYQIGVQERTGSALRYMALRSAAGNPLLARRVRERQDLARQLVRLDELLTSAMVERDEKRIAELRKGKASTEESLRLASDTLKREFPAYAELSAPIPMTLTETQGLLRSDEALLVYLAGGGDKDDSFVWVLTRETSRWERLAITGNELKERVAELRRGMGVEEPKVAAKSGRLFKLGLAHDLYRTLIEPVRDELQGKRDLLIVPSSALTSLPFQLLVSEDPPVRDPSDNQLQAYRDANWLVREHSITVLPSISSLKALRVIAKGRAAPKPLIGFADPVFAPGGASQTRLASGSRGYSAFWRGSSPDLDVLRNLSPLPETATELRAVAKAMSASSSDLYLRAAASETTVKQLDLASYRVVYFATHGLVGGEVRGLAEPALVLSLPLTATELDDGLLTASEVAQLKLNADWVVLSACNTAAGEKVGADAFSGLARAFFYAGARALLVSHWPVESNSAVKLTTSTFDTLRRIPDIGRAESLRRGMIAMIDDSANPWNAYPDYWAPFSVVGEGAR